MDTAGALSSLPVEPGRRDTFTTTYSHGKNALATASIKILPQHVNLTKEESRRIADEGYQRMI